MFLVLRQKQMYFSNTVIIILLNIDLHLKEVGTELLFVPHELACSFVLWPSVFLDDS